MTYSVGSQIQAGDYNYYAYLANLVWGDGGDVWGWGQSGALGNAYNPVSAAQWSTLASRVSTIRAHQTGSGVSFTNTTGGGASNLTSGQRIYQIANLPNEMGNITNHNLNASINPNTGAPRCYATNVQSNTNIYCDIGSQSRGYASYQYSVMYFTWPNSDCLRYFFNAGGYLEFTWNMTNGGTAKTQSWSNLLSDLGTVRLGLGYSAFSGYSGSFGYANAAFNSRNLSGGWARWFYKYNDTGVADYNNNYVDFYIYRSGSTIGVLCYYFDNAGDELTWRARPSRLEDYRLEDYINYPAVIRGTVVQPNTGYISNTWGSVSVSGGST